MINCKECEWFLPVQALSEAEKMHNVLCDTLGDVLPRRDGEIGICRKVTYSIERPVLTRPDGFCHRAERKTE